MLLLSLALAAAPAQPPAAATTIKWNLKAGDTLYAKTTTAMNQKMELMGQAIDMKMDMGMTMRLKVTDVKPDATVVEVAYQKVDLDINMPGVGAIPGLADLGDKFKGATFTVTLNDKGVVTKVDGVEKFMDKLADGDEMTKQMVKGMMGPDAVKQQFAYIFTPTPGKPVAVGDTWVQKDKVSMGGMGKYESTATYKLLGVTDGVAKIGLTADMKFELGGEMEGLPFKITKSDIKVDSFTGTLLFDTKLGRLTDSTSDLAAGGSLSMSAAGMEIDMVMKQKAKVVTVVSDRNPTKD